MNTVSYCPRSAARPAAHNASDQPVNKRAKRANRANRAKRANRASWRGLVLRRRPRPVRLLTLVLALWSPLTVLADTKPATLSDIQDPALRTCVQQALGAGQTLASLTQLKCHNMGIESVAGLETLTGLRKLSLFRNRIRHISVPLPATLESLNLARNRLDTLTLADLPQLRELFVFGNRLTRLELRQLPHLTALRANDNRLTRFEYQALAQLEKLYLFNNKLDTVDIYHLPAMRYMDCRQNPMPDALYDEMDRLEHVTFLHDGNAEDW